VEKRNASRNPMIKGNEHQKVYGKRVSPYYCMNLVDAMKANTDGKTRTQSHVWKSQGKK
jgi:hypothetical protein